MEEGDEEIFITQNIFRDCSEFKVDVHHILELKQHDVVSDERNEITGGKCLAEVDKRLENTTNQRKVVVVTDAELKKRN